MILNNGLILLIGLLFDILFDKIDNNFQDMILIYGGALVLATLFDIFVFNRQVIKLARDQSKIMQSTSLIPEEIAVDLHGTL